jgi:YD repeat-containing protein
VTSSAPNRRASLFQACLIAGVLQAPIAHAQTVIATEAVKGQAAGRTSGQASVGMDGDARYHVPLWVSPGRAGMQPALALNYSSGGDNGIVGVGWSLSGFPRIARCPRTRVQDGQPEEVRFADSDRFCLDGQRLVLAGGIRGTASAYGGHESEYRTEQDSQTKVVSYLPGPQGPRYFKAFLRDGRILTFGGDGNATLQGQRASSRVVALNTGYPVQYGVETRHDTQVTEAWALSRSEDRAGNYLSVRYALDVNNWGYEQKPAEILYTGHTGSSALAPGRSVRFIYENRPDRNEKFSGGLRTLLTQRLSAIEVWQLDSKARDLRLRQYHFAYRNDTLSGRSLLRHFTECDGAGVCLRPTQVRWTQSDAGFRASDLGPFDLALTPRGESHAAIHTGDINGDGLDDLLLRKAGGRDWAYRLSNRIGFGADQPGPQSDPVPPGAPSGQRESEGRLIDLDVDGRADFFVHERPTTPGSGPQIFKNQINRATPTGFTKLPDPAETYEAGNREAYALDLDGDGLPDLVKPVFDTNAPVGQKWATRFNGNGSFGSYLNSAAPYTRPGPLTPVGVEALTADLVGRGTQDLVTGFAMGPSPVALRWQAGQLSVTPTSLLSGCRPMFADVNGDGLADHLDFGSAAGIVRVALNTGNGFLPAVDWAVPAPFETAPAFANPGGCASPIDGGTRIVDFNGDGRDDLLLLGGFTAGGVRTLAVLESTGSGFAPRTLPIQTPAAAPTPWGWRTAQTLDVDGNGRTDFVTVVGGRLMLYKRLGVQGDRVREVIDGLGRFDRFEYEPLNLHSAAPPDTDCAYPRSCVRRGPWLVSRHITDTASKPTGRAYRYSYEDGRLDLAGRGWLGFARRTVVDETTRARVESHFDNVTRIGTLYPCAGFLTLQFATINVAGNAPPVRVRQTTTARTCEPVIAGAADSPYYFVYPRSTRITEAEGVRPARGQQTVPGLRQTDRRETRDAYGNVVETEELTYSMDSGGARGRADALQTAVRYDNHAASWLIGLPARSEVTSATRSGRRVTRITESEFDPETGLLWKSRIAADVPAGGAAAPDPAMEITFTRNAFGLPVRIERRAPAEARTETLEYDDADHAFVTARTNAQGHRLRQSHHAGLGVLASVTDPNGRATRFIYDGFGRIRNVNGPQGADASAGYDLTNAGDYRLTTSASGGTEMRTVYDRIGRETRREWSGPSGRTVGTENNYDALGRLTGRSRPHEIGGTALWERTAYDVLDRPLTILWPDGTQTRREYDGMKTTLWDEKGNQRSFTADAKGRTVESVAVTDNNRAIRTVYSYAPFDLAEDATDAYGNRANQAYDRLGRRIRLIEPNSGTTATRDNPFGETAEESFGNGGQARYERDALGRVRRLTTSGGSSDFNWDSAAHGVGSVATATAGADGVQTVFGYDAFGRTASGTWQIGNEQHAIEWGYDLQGRLALIRYPAVAGHADRFAVRYHYTPAGRLDKVTDAAGQLTFWQAVQRDTQDRVTEERLGNGIVTRRQYGANDRVSKIDSSMPGSAAVQALEFSYEPNGNVHRRHDHLTGSMEEFAYDRLDRLIGWDIYTTARARGHALCVRRRRQPAVAHPTAGAGAGSQLPLRRERCGPACCDDCPGRRQRQCVWL